MIPLLWPIFVAPLVGRRQRGDRARVRNRLPVLNEPDDRLAQREVMNGVFCVGQRRFTVDDTVVERLEFQLESACVRGDFTDAAGLGGTDFALDDLDGG